MKTLFDSTQIRNLKLSNRLFRSATWDGLVDSNGALNDEIYAIYEELAKGGTGTIITGLTDVSESDTALTGNMRLFDGAPVADYKKLTQLVHEYDCNILPQINLNYFAALNETGDLVKKDIDDLSQQDITQIIELFKQAAVRAIEAEFDGVQIHMAFNWLLNRSFNPKYNHRADEYGGTPQKRTKLAVDVLKAIRTALPDTFITAKVGFYSTLDDEDAISQYVCLCDALASNGIDAIEISCNYHIIGIAEAHEESSFLPLAERVSSMVNIPLILVGRNRHPDAMETILNRGIVDYFSLSRALIREPELPNIWQSGYYRTAKCISCDQCFKTQGKRCIFNVQGEGV